MIQRLVQLEGLVDGKGTSVEASLEELKDLIGRHSVTNYPPNNPVENLQYLDEATNVLYVYNTSTKKWLYVAMTAVG